MTTRAIESRTLRTVAAAALGAASMIAHLVVAKAARDALFLSTFHVDLLPRATIAAAGASLVSAVVAARAVARFGPGPVLSAALVASALLHGGEWSLLRASPGAAAVLLYVHVGLLGAATITAFWSLVNERFDPHAAKREVARITMGGTLGGVLGGVVAWQLGGAAGVPALLVVLALLDVGSAVAATPLRPAVTSPGPPASVSSGFEFLVRVPYLRQLALVVALCAMASAMLDYVLGARAVEVFRQGPELVAFFALFHAGIGVGAFLVQLLATRAALERFGLAAAVGLLPAALLGLGGLALLVPRLWAAVVLRAGEGVTASSIYRAGYELSYTPLPPQQKRPAKMLIDVGLDRVGTIVGGGLALLAVATLPGDKARWLTLATIAVAAVALAAARRLHGGYVDALARSLESGAVRLSGPDLVDATTRRTLAETAGIDRRALLAEIERRRAATPSAPGDDPLLVRAADLRSGDLRRARAALSEPLPIELAPLVIDLLGDDVLSRPALAALRSVAPRATGLLVDALLDPERSPVVRRRIPRVLEAAGNGRAARGLIDALSSPQPQVRHQSALALIRMREADQALEVATQPVLVAAQQETERLAAEDTLSERSLDALIAMLSLVLEREPLGLAHRALYGTDPALRGTALEYLENVLPEMLRTRAMSLFARVRGSQAAFEPAPPSLRRRKRRELVEELLRSRETLIERSPLSDTSEP